MRQLGKNISKIYESHCITDNPKLVHRRDLVMCHSINIDLSCAIFSHYTLFKTDIRGFLKDLYFLEVDKQAQGDREYGTHCNFFFAKIFFWKKYSCQDEIKRDMAFGSQVSCKMWQAKDKRPE